jgi:hypothetical protein
MVAVAILSRWLRGRPRATFSAMFMGRLPALEHERDPPSSRAELVVAHVGPIDRDPALLGIGEAQPQRRVPRTD